jgi:hypothetical protein
MLNWWKKYINKQSILIIIEKYIINNNNNPLSSVFLHQKYYKFALYVNIGCIFFIRFRSDVEF